MTAFDGTDDFLKHKIKFFLGLELSFLFQYCCWENPHFSSTVLSELLWQVGICSSHLF